MLAKDYLRALRLRSVICREIDEVMSPYDALLAPGRLTVAAPIDQPFLNPARGVLKDVIGAVGNSAGLPTISVPNGFNDNGLPTGLQIMGRAYEENKILSVACAYQSSTDWHLQHPPDWFPQPEKLSQNSLTKQTNCDSPRSEIDQDISLHARRTVD